MFVSSKMLKLESKADEARNKGAVSRRWRLASGACKNGPPDSNYLGRPEIQIAVVMTEFYGSITNS
jgi:hypothetical protein